MSELIGCDLCGQTDWTHKEKKTVVVPSKKIGDSWLDGSLPKIEKRWVRDKPVSLGEADTGPVYGWEADVHGPYKVEAILCSPCGDGVGAYWSWSRRVAKIAKDKGRPLMPATMNEIEKSYTRMSFKSGQPGVLSHPWQVGGVGMVHQLHSVEFQEDWQNFPPRIAWAKYHELKAIEELPYFMVNEMEVK